MLLRSVLPLVLFLLTLSGCTQLPYQAAQAHALAATNGYLERELAPGVFVIEVQQQRRRWTLLQPQNQFLTLKAHWQTRARELCPYGFQGQPEVITPAEAQIEAFQCSRKICPEQQPLISGVAWCHKRYQL